jgi:16S rRNA C1402 N4-methylase RsmH
MEYHRPVLLQERVNGLTRNPNGISIVVTIDDEYHSRVILNSSNRLTQPKQLLDQAGNTSEIELVGKGGDQAQGILGDNINLED